MKGSSIVKAIGAWIWSFYDARVSVARYYKLPQKESTSQSREQFEEEDASRFIRIRQDVEC